MRNQPGHTKDQIIERGVLADLAINNGLHVQLGGVGDEARRDERGAERRKRVEALGVAPLRHAAGVDRVALPLAR